MQSHGMQMNQDITFLSDGGDDVRELQYYLNPNAEHILDWFHVLNGELHSQFEEWYPGMKCNAGDASEMPLAACVYQ